MAETKRMTTDEVVGYLLEGEGLDFLRESLTWVCEQRMEAEVSELVGAERGERAPEDRLTHRNGYRPRPWHHPCVRSELDIVVAVGAELWLGEATKSESLGPAPKEQQRLRRLHDICQATGPFWTSVDLVGTIEH